MTILDYAANNGVIGTICGLVLTRCLFAVRGFGSTGITYDTFGWFNFKWVNLKQRSMILYCSHK